MDETVEEALAAALHQIYCERLREQGHPSGQDLLLRRQAHEQLRPFAELAGSAQDEYRLRSRQLLASIAAAGFILAPAQDGPNPPFDVEAVAAAEHRRWVAEKSANGWRYATKTDTALRLHSALIGWHELPESKKAIVRDGFRDVPRALEIAGLAAHRTPQAAPSSHQHHASVFISARSADYDFARQVYRALTNAGIAAFFSQESLPALGVSDYRQQIDAALDAAAHMVVVTSSAENVRATWVEAEWGFFINEKRSGRKQGNLVTVVVGGLPPASLPPSLRYYEVIPFEALDNLLRYVGQAPR